MLGNFSYGLQYFTSPDPDLNLVGKSCDQMESCSIKCVGEKEENGTIFKKNMVDNDCMELNGNSSVCTRMIHDLCYLDCNCLNQKYMPTFMDDLISGSKVCFEPFLKFTELKYLY